MSEYGEDDDCGIGITIKQQKGKFIVEGTQNRAINLKFEIHGAHFPIGRPLQDWTLEVQLNKAVQSKSAMSSFKLKVGRFLFFSNALLNTLHCQESASSANDNRRS